MVADTPASAEFWLSLSNMVLVAGLIATGLGAYGSLRMNAARARFAEIEAGRTALETQKAKTQAAEAAAQAEKWKLDSLTAQERLIATERRLEDERAERERRDALEVPRRLNADQRALIAHTLQSAPTPLKVKIFLFDDAEAQGFGAAIAEALRAAGADVRTEHLSPGAKVLQGLRLALKPESANAALLRQAFRAAKIKTSVAAATTAEPGEADATLIVGVR